ncbi:response regulator transcription factor [Vallitalea guaymasensis]|uniref:response regulator transcription factor n=1 Tax=Vallitalea guaymasensis TaxID=1185412 RepID=UPI00272BE513|nr:AraC family transcriptional regulator [Vallitalea guaymasensis]
MSIKTYVVEDIKILRDNIIKKIHLLSSDFKVIGSASNGITALEEIKQLKPVVVITDIKMPVMSGLDLIREIKKLNPHTIFVIISSYNNFEYAKEALTLQVTDYLLKPITTENIEEVLEKIRQKCKGIIKENIYKLMINPDYLPQDYASIFDAYHIFHICIGNKRIENSCHDCKEFFGEYYPYLSFNNSSSQDIFFIPHARSNELTVIIGSYKNNKRISDEFIQQTQSYFKDNYADFNYTIVISRGITSFKQLSQNYIEIGYSLLDNIIFSKSNIVFLHDSNKYSDSKNDKININMLITYLKSKNRKLFRNEIEKIFLYCEERNMSQEKVANLLKNIFSILQEHSVNFDNKMLKLEYLIDDALSNCFTYTELIEKIMDLYNNLISKESIDDNSETINSLNPVIEYIDRHYCENISLNELADMFGFNVSYLSRAFKKYQGVSITYYITKLKMDLAVNLIKENPSILIKDVAKATGYSNQYYFSKVFKSTMGISPSEMFKIGN